LAELVGLVGLTESAERCLIDSDCAFGYHCESRECRRQSKPCPQSCNGRGRCVYVTAALSSSRSSVTASSFDDVDDDVVSNLDQTGVGVFVPHCYLANPYCKAVCACAAGYSGSSCAFNRTTMSVLQSTRAALCEGYSSAVASQDSTDDVILARAVVLSGLVHDMSQVNAAAYRYCAGVLLSTLNADSSKAGSAFAYKAYAEVLSQFLSGGGLSGGVGGYNLSAADVSNITAGVQALATGIQNNMVPNEVAVNILTDSIRMQSVVGSSSWQMRSPSSLLEDAYGAVHNSIRTNVSDSSTQIGASLILFPLNPGGSYTDSVTINLALGGATFNSASRRLTSFNADVSFQVANKEAVQYYDDYLHGYKNYSCSWSLEPYTINYTCASGRILTLDCSGYEGIIVFRCPGFYKLPPVCYVGPNLNTSQRGLCSTVEYNDLWTTCRCNISTVGALQGAAIQSFAADAEATSASFDPVFTRTRQIPFRESRQVVSIITAGTLLGAFLMGLLFTAEKDYKTAQNRRSKHKKDYNSTVSVGEFFDSLMPAEYNSGNGYVIFGKNLRMKHPLLCSLFGGHESSHSRIVAWLLFTARVLNILLADSVLSYYFYKDDGICEAITTRDNCGRVLDVGDVNSVCSWDQLYKRCDFNPRVNAGRGALSVIAMAAVISVAVVPLNYCLETCIKVFSDIFLDASLRKIFASMAKSEQTDGGGQATKSGNELYTHQPLLATIMRAARLVTMQRCMDQVSTTTETLRFLELVLKSHSNQTSLDFVVNKFKYLSLNELPAQLAVSPKQFSRLFVEFIQHHSRDDQNAAENEGYTDNWALVVPSSSSDVNVGQDERGERTSRRDSKTRHPKNLTALGKLIQSVLKQRIADTAQISSKVESLRSDDERDKYLMQQFFLWSLGDVQRRIAERYFYPNSLNATHEWIGALGKGTSMFVLFSYTIFALFYVCYIGYNLGKHAVWPWVLCFLAALALDNIFLIPIRVLLYAVVVPSSGAYHLRYLRGVLRLRAKGILERRSNMLTSASAVIQHFNPACRVARKFPHLIASRLLLTLGDFDIPMRDLLDHQAWDRISESVIAGFVRFQLWLYQRLPNFLADPLIDALGTAVFCLSTYLLAILFLLVAPRWIFYLVVSVIGASVMLRLIHLYVNTRSQPHFMKRVAGTHAAHLVTPVTAAEPLIDSGKSLSRPSPDKLASESAKTKGQVDVDGFSILESGFAEKPFDKYSYRQKWFWKNGYVVRGKPGWMNGMELVNRDLHVKAGASVAVAECAHGYEPSAGSLAYILGPDSEPFNGSVQSLVTVPPVHWESSTGASVAAFGNQHRNLQGEKHRFDMFHLDDESDPFQNVIQPELDVTDIMTFSQGAKSTGNNINPLAHLTLAPDSKIIKKNANVNKDHAAHNKTTEDSRQTVVDSVASRYFNFEEFEDKAYYNEDSERDGSVEFASRPISVNQLFSEERFVGSYGFSGGPSKGTGGEQREADGKYNESLSAVSLFESIVDEN
jgi:hypothetical protein